MSQSNLFILLFILMASSVFSQTTIPDATNVSGTWTTANAPYIIEGRAIVPSGQTLVIEPGVEVRFRSSSSFSVSAFDYSAANVGVLRVQGTLTANGTASNPITFTRDGSGFWGTLLIDEMASDSSALSHCIIEYARESRNVTGITGIVTFNAGLSLYKTAISLSNNEIRNNSSTGVYLRELSSPAPFRQNAIHNNGANGLIIENSTVEIVNNRFYANSFDASGSVAAIRSSNSTAYLVGNLIYDNDDFGIFTNTGGNNYLVNTTIYNNGQGIRVENGANTFIYNCIIQNNNLNFATSSTGGATVDLQHSLSDDSSVPSNVNDVAGNIFGGNALFANAPMQDFSLQASSPCIDAGSSDTVGLRLPNVDILGNPRIDNDSIDMGAIEFQQPIVTYTLSLSADPAVGGTVTGGGSYVDGTNVTATASANAGYSFEHWTEGGTIVSTDSSYSFVLSSDRTLLAHFEVVTSLTSPANSIRVYPNPSSGQIQIDLPDFQSAQIFSADGKCMGTYAERFIDLGAFPAGIYLLRIESNSGKIYKKRLLKQ